MTAFFRLSLSTMRDGAMQVLPLRRLALSLLLAAAGLVAGTAPAAQAQSNGEGTIYSRFGLGSLSGFSASQSQAMGGGGYALRTLNYNPDANPALWSDQVYTRLSGSAGFRSVRTEDRRGNSGQLSSGNVQALQFNFPLNERTLGVGLSFQPYSRSNYSATTADTTEVPSNGQVGQARYQRIFSGSGGLHRLRGGVGYRINEMLSVGATADLLFGIIESRRRTQWPNTQALRDVVVSDGVQLSGLTGTLGAHLALADVLSNDDALSVGASVTLPASLSGERYRTLVEASSDVITVVDSAGTITYANGAVETVLGYEPDEMIGADGDEYVHPADRDSVTETFEAVRAAPGESRTVEFRARSADGSWCWVEATMQNLLDDIDGIVVSGRDVTGHRERERELVTTKERMELALHGANLGQFSQSGGRATDADVSISVEYDPNIEALYQRFEDGGELTDAEIGALVRAGRIGRIRLRNWPSRPVNFSDYLLGRGMNRRGNPTDGRECLYWTRSLRSPPGRSDGVVFGFPAGTCLCMCAMKY